jgi:hypothetical protein
MSTDNKEETTDLDVAEEFILELDAVHPGLYDAVELVKKSRDQQIASDARLEGRLEMLKAISVVGKEDFMWCGVNAPEVLAVLPEYYAKSTADIPAGKKAFLSFMERRAKEAIEEVRQGN